MKTIYAVWEKENIGVNAYEIILDEHDTIESIKEEEDRIRSKGANYIVLKAPVNVQHLLFGLPSLGYTFLEMVFGVQIKRNEYHMPELVTRFDRGFSVSHVTTENDLNRIFNYIRQGLFENDRISIDPYFSLELGNNRYINWVNTLLEKGSFLYEVMLKDRPIGFFIIERKNETTVDPVLMGLYDKANDRGLGSLLHKKTLDTCFTHDCTQLTSTIVSNNASVLRIYVQAGATLYHTHYTYIKHI